MTDYKNTYTDISNRAGGPYFRLLTILPGDRQLRVHEADNVGYSDFEATPEGHDGHEEEPIATGMELEMSVHPIDNCPEYEALSYTWGSPDDKKFAVSCNGHRLIALRNLSNALHALRLPDRRRIIWIDAVCINQSDDKEKGFQVAMMQDIYSRARRTVVWLGLHDESNFAPAFDIMVMDMSMSHPGDNFVPGLKAWVAKHLHELSTEPENFWKYHPELKSRWEKRQHLIMAAALRVKNLDLLEAAHGKDFLNKPAMSKAPKVFHNALKSAALWKRDLVERFDALRTFDDNTSWRFALNNVLCREWWSRVWIIQEACLTPEVIFICGEMTFELDLLFLGMFLNSVFPSNPIFRGHEMPSWCLIQIMEYRTLHEDPSSATLPSLLHLMDEFRASNATNPLDHVYSLMGLISPSELDALERQHFKPAYVDEATGERISATVCYTKAARTICAIANNLDILSVGRPPAHLASESKTGPLPSWAPDLDAKLGGKVSPLEVIELPRYQGSKSQFSACGSCNKWTPYFPRDELLVISGFATDVITEVVAQAMPLSAQSMAEQLMSQMMEEDAFANDDKGEAKFKDILLAFMAILGKTPTIFVEWDQFAQKAAGRETLYPTGEDIDCVSCAVRCFGHMPDGLEAAYSAFKEYRNALSNTRRAYNFAVSKNRLSLPFSKSKASELTEQAKPSKRGQALVGIAQPNKSKMTKFNALQRFTGGRKLAWTRKGYLGLVPAETQPGDHIVLCKGSKLPLVMRAVESNQWRLLEACYIHGIMSGEGWDEKLCVEMEVM